jgi:putative transposase
MFLIEFCDKHAADDAVFSSISHRGSTPHCHGTASDSGLERHGNRNAVERVFLDVKRRTNQFYDTFSHAKPATAESRL